MELKKIKIKRINFPDLGVVLTPLLFRISIEESWTLPVTASGEGPSPVPGLEEHLLHEPGHHLLRPLGAGQGGHLALQVFVAARLAVRPARGEQHYLIFFGQRKRGVGGGDIGVLGEG